MIGCILGGIISGLLSNHWGRKKTLIFASLLFFVSALGSGYPEAFFFTKGEPSITLLLTFNFYRVIGGIGVGLASAVSPMYISEIAPANIRGRLVSFNQFAIIFGMLVVYFVNWGSLLDKVSNGSTTLAAIYVPFRVHSGALFGILLFFVPETPRYLLLSNKDEKAQSVLKKLYADRGMSQTIFQEIKQSVGQATSRGKLFSYGKVVIVIGILLSVFQQFVGINVALYYAPRIFESMGAAKDASMLQTIIMGLVNVLFTVVAILTWISGAGNRCHHRSIGMASACLPSPCCIQQHHRHQYAGVHHHLHCFVHDVVARYVGC